MEVVKKQNIKDDIETRVFEIETPPTYSACLRDGSEFGGDEEEE